LKGCEGFSPEEHSAAYIRRSEGWGKSVGEGRKKKTSGRVSCASTLAAYKEVIIQMNAVPEKTSSGALFLQPKNAAGTKHPTGTSKAINTDDCGPSFGKQKPKKLRLRVEKTQFSGKRHSGGVKKSGNMTGVGDAAAGRRPPLRGRKSLVAVGATGKVRKGVQEKGRGLKTGFPPGFSPTMGCGEKNEFGSTDSQRRDRDHAHDIGKIGRQNNAE